MPIRCIFSYAVVFYLCLFFAPAVVLADDTTYYWYGAGDNRNNVFLTAIDPKDGGSLRSLVGTAETSGQSILVYGDVPHSVYGAAAREQSVEGHINDKRRMGSLSVNSRTTSSHLSFRRASSLYNIAGVADAAVGDSVFGGYAAASVQSSATALTSAISTATAMADSDADAEATASHNLVEMARATVGGDVYGGYASAFATSIATAEIGYNSSGPTSLGEAIVLAKAKAVATASGNAVTIRDATLKGSVFGGFALAEIVTETNTTVISSGSITENKDTETTKISNAQDNTVTLAGRFSFDSDVSGLYGGGDSHSAVSVSPGLFRGNTLQLLDFSANPVREVKNFQNYAFLLPASLKDQDVILTAKYISLQDRAGGQSSIVGRLDMLGGGRHLEAGDEVILLRATDLLEGGITNDGDTIYGSKGYFLLYEFLLQQRGNDIVARALAAGLDPRTKAFAEGRAAGLAFVNQGAELLVSRAIPAAGRAAEGLNPFMAAQAGSSRYNTGSHADVDGFSTIIGLAWNRNVDSGKLLLGAFFEAGWGNYDSHNSFASYASVKGDGDLDYQGGGIFGRFDFKTGPGNLYTEASLRAGYANVDFSTADLRDNLGSRASYDSGSAYYGAHLGLGYKWGVAEAWELDLYSKYMWTHQEGDSLKVFGEPLRLQSADSHRWRNGARLGYTVENSTGWSCLPFFGAAYEYEFDGEAKAKWYSYSTDTPDLGGSTGMVEAGLSLKSASIASLSMELAGQGFFGKREGLAGSVQLKYTF